MSVSVPYKKVISTVHKVLGNTIEEKEMYVLDNCEPMALKNYSLTEFDDCLEDFLHNFLMVYNKKYDTIIVKDLPSITKVTNPGRHRSLTEMFLICRHYFPNCTLKEVKDSLYKLDIGSQICSTIQRRVYELKVNGWNENHSDQADELGYTIPQLKTV